MHKVVGAIDIAKRSLNLKLMLEGGQSFRWTKRAENQWTGVANKILWEITQHENNIQYSAKSNKKLTEASCQGFLKKYLRLDEDLESLYEHWSKADERFAALATESPGLRMLNQEPIENIFSFICSSNNNIVRISSMVENMCRLYGEKVFEEDGQIYYAFPSLESLATDDVESALRAAGFGYRAKFIPKSAKRILEFGGKKWLDDLKCQTYAAAKQNLMQLDGVGPKVADCICLMSLGHLSAVPVDTHVFQIAAKYYLPRLKTVSNCTPKIYEEIHQHFFKLFGPYAGWAHTILFCAELKMFQKEGKREIKSSNRSKKRNSDGCVKSHANRVELVASSKSNGQGKTETSSKSKDLTQGNDYSVKLRKRERS